MAIDWKIFTQRPYIASLPLEEQTRLFYIANEKSIRYRSRSGTGPAGSSFTNTRSLSFDGTDDHTRLSSTISLSGTFTLSAWLKPANISIANNTNIIGIEASNTDKIGIRSASEVQVKLGGSVNHIITGDGTNNFTTGAWQHILVVRVANGNVSFFRNGVAFGSPVSTNSITATFDNIGKFNATNYSEYGLDEVAIFDTDQSSNISSIYNSGIPGDLSSLSPLHWYRFEEGSGTTTTDSGTGGNNGTIIGATYSTDVPT